MNTQVPVINLEELAENAEFICEVLVGRNRMSLRVTTEDHGDFLLVPVIEKILKRCKKHLGLLRLVLLVLLPLTFPSDSAIIHTCG
jgi:hypothetical protein